MRATLHRLVTPRLAYPVCVTLTLLTLATLVLVTDESPALAMETKDSLARMSELSESGRIRQVGCVPGSYTDVSPCSGSATAPPNSSGRTITFSVHNSSSWEADYDLSCAHTGTVTSCSVPSQTLVVSSGSSGQVTLMYSTGSTAGSGSATLIVNDTYFLGTNDHAEGTVSITVSSPTYTVAVTPDGTAVSAGANTTNTQIFRVTNNGSGDASYSLVCSNTMGSCSVSTPQSVTHGAFKDVSVSYHAGPAGTPGTVGLTASYGGYSDAGSVTVTPHSHTVSVVAHDTVTLTKPAGSEEIEFFSVRNTGDATGGSLYHFRAHCTGTTSCFPSRDTATILPGQGVDPYVTFKTLTTTPSQGSVRLTAYYDADTTVRDSAQMSFEVPTVPCGRPTEEINPCSLFATIYTGRSHLAYFVIRNENQFEPVNFPHDDIVVTGPLQLDSALADPSGAIQPGSSTRVTVFYSSDTTEGTGTITLTTSDGISPGSIAGKITLNVIKVPATPLHLLALTPHSTSLEADPSHSYTRNFQLVDEGSDTASYIYDVACTGAAIASGCSTAPDTVLLTAGTPVSIPVSLTTSSTVPSEGKAIVRVSRAADGIMLDSATLHVTVVRSSSPVEIIATAPTSTTTRDRCLSVAISWDASYACGDLRLTYALPATTTRTKTRAPVLFYDSRLAQSYTVVDANVTTPNDGRTPDSVVARLYSQSGSVLRHAKWAGSGWTPVGSQGVTRRVALAFDPVVNGYQTGNYPFTLEVTRWYATGPESDTASGTFTNVQRRNSPYGTGWWIAGLERLRLGDRITMLWEGGDGSTRNYVRSSSDTSVWGAANVDRPDTLRKIGDRYVRELPHGTRVLFDTLTGCHRETVNRLDETTYFTYVDPDNCNRIATITLSPSAAGKTYTFTYSTESGALRLSKITSPTVDGKTRSDTVSMNSVGQLVWILNAVGDTTLFGYNRSYDNRIVRRIGARHDTTFFDYGAYGATIARDILAGPLLAASVPIAADTFAVTNFVGAETRGSQQLGGGVALENAYTKVDGPRTDVGDSTLFWLDALGEPRRIRDALGNETVIERTDATWPALATTVTYPSGQVVGATYDARGNLSSVTDLGTFEGSPPVYATTTYEWDPRWDFVTKTVNPEKDSTVAEYDATNGNLLWQEDSRGTVSRVNFHYYDSGVEEGLLSKVEYASGSRDSLTYDATLANLAKSITPLGIETSYERDEIGRVKKVTQPNDVATGERVTRYYLDLLDRDTLTVDSAGTGSTAQKLSVRQHFDPAGNVDTLTKWSTPDPNSIGEVTQVFTYDLANRKTQLTRAQYSPIVWQYDLAGNLLDGGRTPRAATYDALGRMTMAIGSDTSYYGYDAMGRLVYANNSSARISRAYNLNGTLLLDTLRIATALRQDRDFSTHAYALSYQYDLDGRRRSTSYSGSGGAGTINYAYDPGTGQLGSVTDPSGNVFAYHYDEDARLKALTRLAQGADSITDVRRYDADSRLVRRIQTTASETVIHNDSLVYNRRGRVISNLSNLGAEGGSVTYSPFGMLTHTNYALAPGAENFTMDAMGNMVSQESFGMKYSRSNFSYLEGTDVMVYAAHPPTVPQDTTFYSLSLTDGALEDERVVHRYNVGMSTVDVQSETINTYNRQRQLVQSRFRLDTIPAPHSGYRSYETLENYRYDALGRRVWQRMLRDSVQNHCNIDVNCRSEVTRTVWDGEQILMEMRAPVDDTTGTTQENDGYTSDNYYGRVVYVHGAGIDAPLALYKGSSEVVLYANWRGQFDKATCLAEPCANRQDDISFPAAGASSFGSYLSAANIPWYGSIITGMTDGSGYQYRRNRYYDPKTGRFTKEDPIGLAGGLNLYGYAGGDPISYSDPFGLCPPCTQEQFQQFVNGVAQRTAPWTPMIEVAGTIATLPLTASGDAAIVTLGVAGKASRGAVTLFRGVSAGEAADIAATGELRAGAAASGGEVKYVTNTIEAASKWAAQNGEGARVVQITVPADATRALQPLNGGARIDGIGYGWWGPVEAFKDAVIKFVETATSATPR
jgi:RHS repeat-associated protein